MFKKLFTLIKKRIKIFLLGILLITSAQISLSTELTNIVITATRNKIPLKNAPSKVTVIQKNEIEETGAKTADEILKYISDINHSCQL